MRPKADAKCDAYAPETAIEESLPVLRLAYAAAGRS
jgi:hypothetical protein